MLLISEDTYQRLNSKNDFKVDTTLELEKDDKIKTILDDPKLNNTDKINRYNHVLSREINKRTKKKVKKTNNLQNWSAAIASAVPSYMTAECLDLYKWMELSGKVKWTDAGELIYNKRRVIGSNIVDLLSYSVSKSKKLKSVTGTNQFYEILYKINVPRSLIKIRKRDVVPPEKREYKDESDNDMYYTDESMKGHGFCNWISL